jgi:hypothetical protein
MAYGRRTTNNRKRVKMMKAEQRKTIEFQTFVDLLEHHTYASNAIKQMQVEANRHLLEILDGSRVEYTELQECLAATEAKLRAIALQHPEWFGDKRSMVTPFGSVKMKTSEWLETENEELSIALLEAEGNTNPEFKSELFLHSKKSLNLEALEKMDDVQLRRFRIKRMRDDNFKVEPAEVKLGKAMAANKKTEQQRAKAA